MIAQVAIAEIQSSIFGVNSTNTSSLASSTFNFIMLLVCVIMIGSMYPACGCHMTICKGLFVSIHLFIFKNKTKIKTKHLLIFDILFNY